MPNARCPMKGKEQCNGHLCGHCPKCQRPWDNHDGLSTSTVTCPKT